MNHDIYDLRHNICIRMKHVYVHNIFHGDRFSGLSPERPELLNDRGFPNNKHQGQHVLDLCLNYAKVLDPEQREETND